MLSYGHYEIITSGAATFLFIDARLAVNLSVEISRLNYYPGRDEIEQWGRSQFWGEMVSPRATLSVQQNRYRQAVLRMYPRFGYT